ncbi:L,D-transpeptidase [Ktedonobacter robiniae]|uniref:L,D-TPase catalytic domain-containing protein n=1 Tax=Ktedonobacter robiniae TaxID=2778365 RepID=A0ABQ3ULE3_9CHLR|nr:L,D-transpeptidase [Ktedonobacter robiniae]GHO53513.1 hypothetical protein KSB_19880 [Ktedonobacter robiniae]
MQTSFQRSLLLGGLALFCLLSLILAPQALHRVYAQGYTDQTTQGKRIVVSISQQELTAYEGDKEVFDTLVTTGRTQLPTPTGTFHVLQKLSPTWFHSPWPKNSKYYYPPTYINYALAFKDGGFFLHDATWRSSFGPGTSDDNQGSHGCVSMNLDSAKWLYNWAPVGTTVQIE